MYNIIAVFLKSNGELYMFTKTKLTKTLAAVGICCLSTMALAGGPDMPQHDLYSGGFGLGSVWTEHMGYGIQASYTTDELTASLATEARSYKANNSSATTRWEWAFTGQLGLRDRIGMENLFVTYGAGAGVAYLSQKSSFEETPWYVGPFVGLDYQPLRHFMVSGSIFPVTYGKTILKGTTWGFFNEGDIALSYIF
jgi:hypothetical protein